MVIAVLDDVAFSTDLDAPGRRMAAPPQRDQFTPLRKSPKEILTKGKGILRTSLKMQTLSFKRNKDKFCDYHEDHGHDTDDCKDLKC